MKALFKRAALLAALVGASVALAGCGINTIPTREEAAKARWADVQAQYQRRADLVPNLVQTVQAAAVSERAILNDVISARAQATAINVSPEQLSDPQALARFEAAQSNLGRSLGRLLLVVERYPEIRSNQNFLMLQSQLEGTENRIAVARRDYNEAVQAYNTSLRTFPTVVWANTIHSGSKPMALFEAAPDAQAAPTVTFDQIGPRTTPGAAPPASAGQTAPAPAPAQ